jgi:hypothetical protein
MDYLNTGKMDMKPGFYMKVYTSILRICDEYDKAEELYIIYKRIVETYINQTIQAKIQMKMGDSRELLDEYVG